MRIFHLLEQLFDVVGATNERPATKSRTFVTTIMYSSLVLASLFDLVVVVFFAIF